jgi:hypothetical protein
VAPWADAAESPAINVKMQLGTRILASVDNGSDLPGVSALGLEDF